MFKGATVPSISISFPLEFPDKAWAGSVYCLEAPAGDHGHHAPGEWIIGRHPAADLTVAPRSISAQHCAITYSYAASRWAITDLQSTNGTRVNGELLSPGDPRPVRVGDRVHLGPHLINLVEDAQDTVDSGPTTIVGTAPLDHRTGETLATAPPAPKTYADTLDTALQWLINPKTRLGALVRLLVLVIAAAVFVLVQGWES